MKRLFVSVMIGLVFALNLVLSCSASASSLPSANLSSVYLADTPVTAVEDWVAELEKEVLPKLENIFTPEQREQFKEYITSGISFRKAFKSLTLTPDQKTQLKTLLQSLPKKDAFASLTPEQKQKLFAKKKEAFIPTSPEIMDQIKAGMNGKNNSMPEAVKKKMDAIMKQKESFMNMAEQ